MIAGDFARFMEEVHGHPPFPWQSEAVAEILRTGTWPSLVDVPTGLGKTSMLDVAVFILAMSAGGDAPSGLGRRRIFLVVDRRIVVDQAEAHGRCVAEALEAAPPGSVSEEIARRLRGLTGSDSGPALAVVKMRGGTTWDAAWLPLPDLPAIITGTVDQVGSRLFFRGYGVSARRRPIDAALVGTDSVIMIDEAHLAQALTASLEATRSLDSSQVLGLPGTSVVHLSATSAERPAGWVTAFDEDAHLDNPTARARLTAAKTLAFVDTTKQHAVRDISARAAEAVTEADSRVLVVCNTVDRAREVHQRLLALKDLPSDTEVLLLMGRSRPLDREAITTSVTELFGADRDRKPGTAVLVATQTVEVGIDLDATALVTETASWDALVQRIGRVNRRGELPGADVVVVEDNDPKPPVYGDTKIRTAEFLRSAVAETGPADVSPLALRHLDVPDELVSEAPLLPLLLPAQLDAWVRTSPVPAVDPPLDPYLHGIDTSVAPVTVAWRDGLRDAWDETLPAGEVGATIEAMPLRAEECVEIPLGALRRWLRDEKPWLVGDTEDYDDFDIPFGDDPAPEVLRRVDGDSGSSTWEWSSDESLRPGDVIVVPTDSGGLDRFGWAPSSTDKVSDVSELAACRRGQAALRLDPELPGRLGMPSPPGLQELVQDWCNCEDPDDREELQDGIIAAVRSWLARHPEPTGISRWSGDDLADLRDRLAGQVALTWGGGSGSPVLRAVLPETNWLTVDDGNSDETSHLNRRVTLAVHLEAVGARADGLARRLGLPEPLRRTVADAARWHDLGKVDPRFQAMLFGGDPIRAELADEPLAKSGMPPGDRQQFLRARKLSGLPRGARHETWSEVLVANHLAGMSDTYRGDPELLCHLVASHHGHARPFLPPVLDTGKHTLEAVVDGIQVVSALPAGVRLSDADRFARLNARYGRWGLALLEAIVRCADMTVSSEGS
jgi:CRISPR-associated helicase cas3, anaes-subtype